MRDPAVWSRERIRPPARHSRATVAIYARVTFLLLIAAALAWPLVAPSAERAAAPGETGAAAEWPREFEGRALRPLALGAVEQRFAAQFPGAIGRFTDGRRTVILRRVREPTRMLHPAADCFRGLGYAIGDERLERTPDGLRRCFAATTVDGRLRVCERIVDARGVVYTDASSWYWAAALGRSDGPWLATTVAERVP